MNVCSTCKINEVSKGRCSECNRVYMRTYRAANLEKVKAGQRDHYNRNRELVIQKVKTYAVENKGKVKASKARRYDETKEARRAKIKEWQDKNPEKYKEISRACCLNRIARKAKAPGRYFIKDVRRLYDAQNGECVACKASLLGGYHVDHVVPLSKGGDNWPTNLQLLCPSCNVRKSDMSMGEFMARNFEKLDAPVKYGNLGAGLHGAPGFYFEELAMDKLIEDLDRLAERVDEEWSPNENPARDGAKLLRECKMAMERFIETPEAPKGTSWVSWFQELLA